MRLLEIRKGKGYTQAKLSNLSGVSQGKISEYEQGATVPRLDICIKLATALGVTLDELAGTAQKAV